MPTTYIGMGPDGPNSNLTELERKARNMKREASLDARRKLAIELSNKAIAANKQAMGIKGDYLSPSFQALIKHALR
jgi:hypothetical protein